MELNITQEELKDGILDNLPDKMGNKIRLREISYANSKRHVRNIPFHNHTTVSSNNTSNSITSDKIDFDLKNIDTDVLHFGAKKPINLKENMINNLNRHVASFYKQDQENTSSPSILPSSDSLLMQSVEEKGNISGVDQKFEQIANAREFIKDVKSKADSINAEVKQLDDELSRLGAEDAESQKRLQDALMRQEEIKKQIEDALEKQHITLSETRKKFELLISDAEKQKKQREKKIVQFQEKIAKTGKQLADVENDIAQQQEILNALRQLESSSNVIDFSSNIGNTQTERKIV